MKKDKLEQLFSEFEIKNSEKRKIFGGANTQDCTTGITTDTYCKVDNKNVLDDYDNDGCDAVIVPIDTLPKDPML